MYAIFQRRNDSCPIPLVHCAMAFAGKCAISVEIGSDVCTERADPLMFFQKMSLTYNPICLSLPK